MSEKTVEWLADVLEWLSTDMEYAARYGQEPGDLERWREAADDALEQLRAQAPLGLSA
jgi:hypothetical protein